jgi:glucose/arabinose dehydrogenase
MRNRLLGFGPRLALQLTLAICTGLAASGARAEVELGKLKLPPGFAIEVFAKVPDAREMALGDDGVLYVGSRADGPSGVYAVKDGKTITIAEGLEMPSGVAYRNGDLYVGAVSQILRYRGIGAKLAAPPAPEVVTDALPKDRHHGWKFLRFGPDGKLYVPVGAPCNVCTAPGPLHARILTLDVSKDKPTPEVFAEGVRNSVGFDWDPATQELWFTDNGRDLLGDDAPPDELNHAPRKGMNFGFPYFHAGDIPDPEFKKGTAKDYEPPAQKLGPHVAALGMSFYTGKQFPEEYRGQILIPEHGSWNRTPQAGHTGYRIMRVTLRDNRAVAYEPFITGWLGENNQSWGRPNATLVMPDGSLLISDDQAGVIYRVTYKAPPAPARAGTGE